MFKAHSLTSATWPMLLLLIPTLGKLHTPFSKVHFGFLHMCASVVLPSTTETQPWTIGLLANVLLKTRETEFGVWSLERPAAADCDSEETPSMVRSKRYV